jgi:cell fate (sporulation/competence/biofilm development) regulator YlbF (YheA/YmcA/DUF963 family)
MIEVITKVDEIIDDINNDDSIKRLKELKIIIDNDKDIQVLLNNFKINKEKYESSNIITEGLILSKKQLYENDTVYEYNKLLNNLNFSLASFNRKILRLIDNKSNICGKI